MLDREDLEKLSLLAVCSCNYYDLADNIEITSDEELWQIIDNQDIECENCKQ